MKMGAITSLALLLAACDRTPAHPPQPQPGSTEVAYDGAGSTGRFVHFTDREVAELHAYLKARAEQSR